MNPLLNWFFNLIRPIMFRWLLTQNCPVTKNLWFIIAESKQKISPETTETTETTEVRITILYSARLSNILYGLKSTGVYDLILTQ
jgi:hypothetical protein